MLLFLLVSLLGAANVNSCRKHLSVDVHVFSSRARAFLEADGWNKLGRNEYQPGALYFFSSVALGLDPSDSGFSSKFQSRLFYSNAFLLLVLFGLSIRSQNPWGCWVFVLVVAACGPILLFRFEVLVSLLVLWGLIWMREERLFGAGFMLGLGILTKVYPGVFLLAFPWMSKKEISRMLSGLFLAAAFVAGIFLLNNGKWSEAGSGLMFHVDKPVGVDGPAGSLFVLMDSLGILNIKMAARNGVHGFDVFPGWWPSALQLLGVAALVLFISATRLLSARRGIPISSFGYFFALINLGMLFGKSINPQYAWWSLSLLPFVERRWFTAPEWGVVLSCVFFWGLLQQVVYPYNYTEFLSWFHSPGGGWPLALASANGLKNLCLVVLCFVSLRATFRNLGCGVADKDGDGRKAAETVSSSSEPVEHDR